MTWDCKRCAAWLREQDRFLLLTHIRPDGDTLGSAAALCLALRRLGKEAWLYPNPDITDTYLPFIEDLLAPAAYRADTVVAADIADSRMLPRGFEGSVDLMIDHHPGGTPFAPRSLIRAEKAACGEIILELLELLTPGITRREADLLYIAVSTDTGCFAYANVKADTLRDAARLLELGADNAALNQRLFRCKTRARLLLEGAIYSGIRSYKNNELNIAVITEDMIRAAGAKESDCEDLAGLAGQVAGSRVSVTVRETGPGRSKLSLRTDGDVNATELCARFGGGGHRMASGCEMELPPEEAAEVMRKAIEEVWP